MKIFVTGGTGFIGSYVIRELLKTDSNEVIAIRREKSRMHLVSDLQKQIKWVECDLFDIVKLDELISECEYIIHVAGAVSFSESNKKRIFKTNIEGTSNLVNIAIERGIKRFIHFSSVAALGFSQSIIDETQVWTEHNSKSVYALSKYLGEREAWRGFAEGVNMSIINPSFVLGGSYWDYGPLNMISKIDQSLKYYPTGTNGIVDVRDVAKMCTYLLSQKHMSGQRFICNAKNISHFDLMKMMCDELEKSYPSIPLSGLLGDLAWRIESTRARLTGTDSLFSREAYKIASSHLSYDNSRSRNLLNFEYMPIDKSVRDMIQCYKRSKINNLTYGVFN